MPELNVGVHLSLGSRPRDSLAEIRAHGATCAQIFASSPGAWKPPALDPARIEGFVLGCAELGIEPTFIHAVYLINLASADPLIARRSRDSLAAALEAASALHVSGVVTHVGSHGGRGYAAISDQVAAVLRDILDSGPADVDLLLENSAGAGGILGSDLCELADIIARADRHPRLRVALDTAHLCAVGWDFTEGGAAARLLERIQGSVGADRLAVIHANDSKVPCGSRRDRHACVGEGYIGAAGFLQLLSLPALTAVPWILETPDLDAGLPADQRFRSLRALKALA
jgi:deoxyribonuclease IV